MTHPTYTPEVMVALAAGHLRREVAVAARAFIETDADLSLEYEGVQALVAELGPAGALSYLEQAHDRQVLRSKPMRRTQWPWMAALVAAAIAILVFFVIRPWDEADPMRMAEAALDQPPAIERVRGGEHPSWAVAFEQGDHAAVIAELESNGAGSPLECLILAHSLLHIEPSQDSLALYYLERGAKGGERYRDEALLKAGALALRMGDKEYAVRSLCESRDQRALALCLLLQQRTK